MGHTYITSQEREMHQMTLEQHLKAAKLLHEIQQKINEVAALMPNRPMKDYCRSSQRHLQKHVINRLRFDHWEAAKNPAGGYAFSLHDDPYPAVWYS